MISFSDNQLSAIMLAASVLRPDDRAAFLQLVADQLKVCDLDVKDATVRAFRFFQERGVVTDAGPH